MPVDVTLYEFIVQILFSNEEEKIKNLILGGKLRQNIVIHSDIEIPVWAQSADIRNVVRI
jgi:hypothetical protein